MDNNPHPDKLQPIKSGPQWERYLASLTHCQVIDNTQNNPNKNNNKKSKSTNYYLNHELLNRSDSNTTATTIDTTTTNDTTNANDLDRKMSSTDTDTFDFIEQYNDDDTDDEVFQNDPLEDEVSSKDLSLLKISADTNPNTEQKLNDMLAFESLSGTSEATQTLRRLTYDPKEDCMKNKAAIVERDGPNSKVFGTCSVQYSQRGNHAQGHTTYHDYDGDNKTEQIFNMLLDKSGANKAGHHLTVQPGSFTDPTLGSLYSRGSILFDCDACGMEGITGREPISISNHLKTCSKGLLCPGCDNSDAFLMTNGEFDYAGLQNHRRQCQWNKKMDAIKKHVKANGNTYQGMSQEMQKFVHNTLGHNQQCNCGMNWQKEEILKLIHDKPVANPCKCMKCYTPPKKCFTCGATKEKIFFKWDEYRKGSKNTNRICKECNEKEESKEGKKKKKKKTRGG